MPYHLHLVSKDFPRLIESVQRSGGREGDTEVIDMIETKGGISIYQAFLFVVVAHGTTAGVPLSVVVHRRGNTNVVEEIEGGRDGDTMLHTITPVPH